MQFDRSTVAHQIVSTGLADDLVLIDTNESKVKADALDFEDAMANLPYHTNIFVNDYAELKDTDVIISALGNIKLQDNANDDRSEQKRADSDLAAFALFAAYSGQLAGSLYRRYFFNPS